MRECALECFKKKKECDQIHCRYWINHGEEYNCVLLSIELNGDMTLQQTGERLGISAVRVKQIQDKTLKKINFLSVFDVLH